MSDRDEWGPWVEHDGKGRPVRAGVMVEARLASGVVEVAITVDRGPRCDEVDVWDWHDCRMKGPWSWRVIRYRIRRPRGMAQIEAALNVAPVDAPAITPKETEPA